MVSGRALSGIISGAIMTVLGIYWSINPLGFFEAFCLSTPCGASLVFSGIIFIIGVAILVAGVVTAVRERRAQTMVISMGAEAASDAEAVSSIQTSVEKGENAEEAVPAPDEDAEYKPKEEAFAELPGDEEKPAEAADAAPAKKKAVKKAPAKKVAPKKAKPVKKAAKKKK